MSNLPPEQNPESELPPAMPPSPSPYPRDFSSTGNALVAAQEEKSQAMLCWILSIFFAPIPAIIFFFISNDKPYLKRQAGMALTLGIVLTAAIIVLFITIVGALLVPLLGLANLVICIMGAIATNKGENYNAPVIGDLTTKLFKV